MHIYIYLCSLDRNCRRNNHRTITTSLHPPFILYLLILRPLFICGSQNILDIFTFSMDAVVELSGRQQCRSRAGGGLSYLVFLDGFVPGPDEGGIIPYLLFC